VAAGQLPVSAMKLNRRQFKQLFESLYGVSL